MGQKADIVYKYVVEGISMKKIANYYGYSTSEYFKLGYSHLQLKDNVSAKSAYTMAIRTDLKAYKAMNDLAFIYAEEGDYEAAAEYAMSVLKLCSRLVSVNSEFSNQLTKICDSAFFNCPSLKDIELSGVTEIGEYAFGGCREFSSVEFSNNLAVIKDNAFSSCYKLKSITLPDNLEELGDKVFDSCDNLKKITIPHRFEDYFRELRRSKSDVVIDYIEK